MSVPSSTWVDPAPQPAFDPAVGPAAPRRKPKRHKSLPLPAADADAGPARRQAEDLGPGFDAANLRRCPGCGGMVYLWPCLACQHRNAA